MLFETNRKYSNFITGKWNTYLRKKKMGTRIKFHVIYDKKNKTKLMLTLGFYKKY
jgi:hypothetical protein